MADTRERDLVQLVYVSRAASGLTQADLDTIAAVSEARNKLAGLTGLLLHQGEAFYGVLEGRTRKLLPRMEVIARDSRHARLRVLREEPVERRRFGGWTFGVLPPHAAGEQFVLHLAKGLP